MKVGLLLLSQDNYYIDNYGRLPARPNFDKELLVALCRGQRFTCGSNTMEALPDSILKNSYFTAEDEYDINLGMITLIDNPPHLLIVTRSQQYIHIGKHFSLSDYSLKFKSNNLEIYIHK